MRKFSILLLVGLALLAGWLVAVNGHSGDQKQPLDEIPVIRADKDPIKELPEDPGGMEIAGQDNTLFSVLADAEKEEQENTVTDFAEVDTDAEKVQGFVIPLTPEMEVEQIGVSEFEADVEVEVSEPEETVAEVLDAPESAVEAVEEVVEAVKEEAATAQTSEDVVETIEIVKEAEPKITHEYQAEPVIKAESNVAPPELKIRQIDVTPPRRPNIPQPQKVVEKILEPAPRPNVTPMMNADTITVQKMQPVMDEDQQKEDEAQSKSIFSRWTNPKRAQPIVEEKPESERTAGMSGGYVGNSKSELEPAAGHIMEQTMVVEEAPSEATQQAVSASGNYYAQLSSVPTQDGAKQTWDKLRQRYPALLNGKPVRFQRAEIEGRGTFYRVQAGGMSESSARSLCAELSALGKSGGCLVVRGE